MNSPIKRIRVIDSHTGGEPTRVVISGGPDLGAGPLSDRVERFRSEYDDFRCAVSPRDVSQRFVAGDYALA